MRAINGVLLLCTAAFAYAPAPRAPRLKLIEIGADSTAFDVVATLVVGPRNVVLWDAQYHASDAVRVADAIQATGKHLQAIVLSHPDEDHYTGAAAIVARFPGTPVYMTPAAIKFWDGFAPKRFKQEKPGTVPDSLIRPAPLPSNIIMLDGEKLEVIADLVGDNPGTNSVLWIPSLKTVLASDVVFQDVHPWLGASDSASMVAWRAALDRIAALKPVAVVAGHKADVKAADTPATLGAMKEYLTTFDALRQRSANVVELRDSIWARYPTYKVRMLAAFSAGAAMRKKMGAATALRWTGTFTNAGGMTLNLTFDVVPGPEPAITINSAQGSFKATNVKLDGDTLSFTFAPGAEINCVLKRQAAGFAGECSNGAQSGTMQISAPRN